MTFSTVEKTAVAGPDVFCIWNTFGKKYFVFCIWAEQKSIFYNTGNFTENFAVLAV